MPKFEVVVQYSGRTRVIVEAEHIDAAMEEALEAAQEIELPDFDSEISTVREIQDG